MEANAMVLTHFNALLEPREFEIVPLKPGEVLVKLQSSGICGSDVHMWKGNDPRTPVPIILGHEGVGVIAEIGVQKYDVHGEILKPGDAVVFDRGLTCGECYFCKAKHKPYLCPSRKTYGISIGCSTPPYLNGCYAEYIHLDSRIKVVKLNGEYDPDVLVSATCSGATIAHSFDMCRLEPGDTVVIQGPGATGIYSTAFAKEAGAENIIVIGTERSRHRLELCKEFGATDILINDKTTADERIEFVRSKTQGRGAELVVECTGNVNALAEGVKMVAPGGMYALPGIATPVGYVEFDVYTDICRKNVALQGSWVNDYTHLEKAVRLVLSGKYPFNKIVTHRYPLKDANIALEMAVNRKALKAVINP